jgi:hypothetical protein
MAKAIISAKSLKEMIRWKDREIEPDGGWEPDGWTSFSLSSLGFAFFDFGRWIRILGKS